MATIRSYTTVEQSRKLAEILPLESADMRYEYPSIEKDEIQKPMIGFHTSSFNWFKESDSFIYFPCWSLAALLNVIPSGQVNRMANSDKWEASSWNDSDFEPAYYVEDYDNPVDACYELILKLNELNLL